MLDKIEKAFRSSHVMLTSGNQEDVLGCLVNQAVKETILTSKTMNMNPNNRKNHAEFSESEDVKHTWTIRCEYPLMQNELNHGESSESDKLRTYGIYGSQM